MSTYVHGVKLNLSEKEERSIQNKLYAARTVAKQLAVVSLLEQLYTKQMDSQKEEVVEANSKEFISWIQDAKKIPMKQASWLLNDNAWKINSIRLIPDYGDDPETNWTGFMSFIDNPSMEEITAEDDDYRVILKKFALYAASLDLGE